MSKSFVKFGLLLALLFIQANSFSLSWSIVKTLYSTKVKYTNSAAVPVYIDYGHGWVEYPRQELLPGSGVFYLPKNVNVINLYMDGYRYMINDVVQPSLFKYAGFINPPKLITNGELSNTDNFVRFSDGTNGLRAKFTTNSAGAPPSQEPILTVYADSSENTLRD